MIMNDRSTIEYNLPATAMKLGMRWTAPVTIWTFGPRMTAEAGLFGENGGRGIPNEEENLTDVYP